MNISIKSNAGAMSAAIHRVREVIMGVLVVAGPASAGTNTSVVNGLSLKNGITSARLSNYF